MSAYVVERFWPGSTEAAARDAIELLRTTAEALASTGLPVRFLSGTFVQEDEAVYCRFEGTADAIRRVHATAGLPYDRLLPSVDVP